MGFACSDAKKRPHRQITRFCSSIEEIYDDSTIFSSYTAGNQNVDFEGKKKNELRNASSITLPGRMKYYGRTKKRKTRSINRKIVTLTEQGTTRTLTISKQKITRSRSYEQFLFQGKGDCFECKPEYFDLDGTPRWSPTQSVTVSSDEDFPILRLTSKMGSGETKSESSAISCSPISPGKVLKAKHMGGNINQEKPTNNESMLSSETASNIKLYEIGPLAESTSSQVPC